MLTFHKVAAGAKADAKALTAHLMEQTLPEADTAIAQYYLRTGLDPSLADAMASIPSVRSDIDPAVAEVLALTPGAVIGEEQLAAILSGRRADGEDIPGSQHKINSSYKTSDGETRYKISGMDLCFSAPKSVSVAWMAAKTEAERNSILQASRDARDAALRYIESEINGRASTGGRQYTEAGKIGWIAIDHFTARPTIKIRRADPETGVIGTELYTLMPKTPGDPQLHHHTIVPNVMVTESGKTIAINTKRLHGRIHDSALITRPASPRTSGQSGSRWTSIPEPRWRGCLSSPRPSARSSRNGQRTRKARHDLRRRRRARTGMLCRTTPRSRS